MLVPPDGGPERQLSADPPPRPGRGLGGGCYDWLPDGTGLVYVGADGSLWCQPLAVRAPALVAEHEPEDSVQAPAVAPDRSCVAYVTAQQLVRVAPLRPGGTAATLPVDGDFAFDPCWWERAGRRHVVWQSWSVPDMPWDQSHLAVATPTDAAVERIACPGHQLQQPRPNADGVLGALCDGRGWLNVWRVDPSPAAPLIDEVHEHGGPAWGMGQRSWCWSPAGTHVAFCRNEQGFGRLCVAEVASGAVTELGRGVHGGLEWRGSTLVALRSGAVTPTEVVVYDVATAARRALAVGPLAGWEDAGLVEPVLLTVPAEDGSTLHARLYPAERPDGRVICWLHGGPTDQWQVTFMPRLAYWRDRGWSILVPDHRGSTGHGRAYQQALDGRWGELDVVDTAAAIHHVHHTGVADPGRTVLMGSSAGGLTALLTAAHHPELVAAAVVLYPVSDLVDLSARSHRFERHSLEHLVGPLPAARDRYLARSPLHLADRLAATPLLVLHGDADPVVPVDQSVALAERVLDAGGDVELRVYAGEGHGFRASQHQLDEYLRIGAFFERHGLSPRR
jgi:dipeptidyl aminopeptidase/acylaminoacyl peptidase